MLHQALKMGDFLGFAGSLGNDLEPAALAVEPRLSGIRDWLRDRAPVVALSGSGATWYAVTPEDRSARDLALAGSAPGAGRPAGLRRLVACRTVSHGARLVRHPAS